MLPTTDCAGCTVSNEPSAIGDILRRNVLSASASGPSASIRRAVPASARPFYPASTSVRRSHSGRPGPGLGGRLSTARCRSLSGSGSPRSPSPCTAKARHPHAPDRLQGQPSASLRGLGHWQTLRRLPPQRHQGNLRHHPQPLHRLRDCQQPRVTGELTPRRQC